jgi:hypothetical protein
MMDMQREKELLYAGIRERGFDRFIEALDRVWANAEKEKNCE